MTKEQLLNFAQKKIEHLAYERHALEKKRMVDKMIADSKGTFDVFQSQSYLDLYNEYKSMSANVETRKSDLDYLENPIRKFLSDHPQLTVLQVYDNDTSKQLYELSLTKTGIQVDIRPR